RNASQRPIAEKEAPTTKIPRAKLTPARDDRGFSRRATSSSGTVQVAKPNTTAPTAMIRPDAGTKNSKIKPSAVTSGATVKRLRHNSAIKLTPPVRWLQEVEITAEIKPV